MTMPRRVARLLFRPGWWSLQGTPLGQFFFAIATVKHRPFRASLNDFPLKTRYFAPDCCVHWIALCRPFSYKFASLTQGEGEIWDFGEMFGVQSIQRLSRKIQDALLA
jgi:hypothetical protein